jgi:hypothetical protein
MPGCFYANSVGVLVTDRHLSTPTRYHHTTLPHLEAKRPCHDQPTP